MQIMRCRNQFQNTTVGPSKSPADLHVKSAIHICTQKTNTMCCPRELERENDIMLYSLLRTAERDDLSKWPLETALKIVEMFVF